MSNLVAENTFLREKLGLKAPEQVTSIMFQNMVADTLASRFQGFFPSVVAASPGGANPPEDPKKKPGRRSRNAFQEMTGNNQLMLGRDVVKSW